MICAFAMIAALLTVIIGAVMLRRRRRIQMAYDEMRRLYGADWR